MSTTTTSSHGNQADLSSDSKSSAEVGPIVSVEHVCLDFRKEKEQLPVIVDVSFEAWKDEFVTITGPSGCGKSTLLRTIGGLNKPSSGAVKFRDSTITGPNWKLR